MADPLSIAGLAIGAIGTGIQAIGSMQSSNAQQQAANYQAQVAQNNAIIASQNAEAATQAGQVQALNQSLQQRAALGAVTAAAAGSNVDVNTGSALDTRVTQRAIGALDPQTVASNAALEAYGYKSQATNYQAQSGLYTLEAQQAGKAGPIGAAGSLLSGASSLGLKWASLQNVTGSTDNSVVGWG